MGSTQSKSAQEQASCTLSVGADGFEPPKSKDSRFTVCPIWPLWKTPLGVGAEGFEPPTLCL